MKTIIITGASDGLGLETAEKFLKKGWRVISLSRTQPNIDIEYIKTDLTKENSIKEAVATIKEKYSSFDCVINCAGVMDVSDLKSLKYAEVESLFKLNVLAPMMLVSGLIENIKKNEADIVNVGSTVGFKAYENQCAYGASKWAVRGINENLQLELKGTKCRIIGFNPGGFKSRIFEKATGIKTNLDAYMDPEHLADLLVYIIELPKSVEVSQIIINRK
ncbi:MAG: SDR family NAD(P)-dependent oxidoreductase [Parcubacteria group bacterium]|jgi:NADP-dependent 3-hydroxy acid dehydrogenase YdfG